MTDDLITSLRALAAAQRRSLNIAFDAAIEIENFRAENKRLRAEVERLREALKIAAIYVNSCYHEWYQPHDLAEALRDLTKIREVLNDERAGELEGKP